MIAFALPHILRLIGVNILGVAMAIVVFSAAAWVFSKNARRSLNKRLLKLFDRLLRLLWRCYLFAIWRPVRLLLALLWSLTKRAGGATRDAGAGLLGAERTSRLERELERKEQQKNQRRISGEALLEDFDEEEPVKVKRSKAPKAPRAPRPPRATPSPKPSPAPSSGPVKEFDFPEI